MNWQPRASTPTAKQPVLFWYGRSTAELSKVPNGFLPWWEVTLPWKEGLEQFAVLLDSAAHGLGMLARLNNADKQKPHPIESQAHEPMKRFTPGGLYRSRYTSRHTDPYGLVSRIRRNYRFCYVKQWYLKYPFPKTQLTQQRGGAKHAWQHKVTRRFVAVRLLRFTYIQSLNEAPAFVAVDVPAAGGARTIIASLPPST